MIREGVARGSYVFWTCFLVLCMLGMLQEQVVGSLCLAGFCALYVLAQRYGRSGELFVWADKLLHDSHSHLDTLTSRLNITLYSRSLPDGKIKYISEAAQSMFGISLEALTDNSSLLLDIVHPDDKALLEAAFAKTHTREAHDTEFRIYHRLTGELRWIRSRTSYARGNRHGTATMFGLLIDTTASRLSESILREQNDVLRMVALGSSLSDVLHAIASNANAKLTDRYCSILLYNERTNTFENGASPNFPQAYFHIHIDQMKIDSTSGPIGRAAYYKKPIVVADILHEPEWRDTIFSRSTQSYGINSLWCYPIVSSAGRVLGVINFFSRQTGRPESIQADMIEAFANLTSLCVERLEKEREIHQLAYYDTLTGLGNRRSIVDQLQRLVAAGDEGGKELAFALLFIDLDQFKIVNDSLGHEVGDLLLAEVARRLAGSARECDLLARLGGDEFLFVVRDVSGVREAELAAKLLMLALDAPIALAAHEVKVTPSIGISLFPHHGTDVHELLKYADSAMHQAKREGRNGCKVFDASIARQANERFAIKSELPKSLARGEFSLHYQPRVELGDNRVKGVEALIRWTHPEKGRIMPADFIPLAEESGYIVRLGEWVLLEACRQNKRWQEDGWPPVRVAVNVSVQQLRQPGFVDIVKRTLQETGLAAQWLEIEITESALMSETDKMAAVLAELGQLGVYVSIDDFGTGYSSLHYLKRFRVDALKIDQSFVRGLPHDSEDAAITSTIVALARNLRLKITAEGVETEEQVRFLERLGCDSVQGYYYGKPVPASEAVGYFRDKRTP